MRAETLTEKLFFTTCYLRAASTEMRWTGTGFFYQVETTRGAATFLVTNKHVLGTANRVDFLMIGADSAGAPQVGRPVEVTLTIGPEDWFGHADPSVDVAIMPFWPVLAQMKERGSSPFLISVTPDLCLGSASPPLETDALETVTFFGYPQGLFDSANFLPIARRGTTATPIEVDYEGRPAFLIDASVFPGSSGSPVFLADIGMYRSRAGDTHIGSRIGCLGVLAAVHTRRLEGSVEVVPTSLVARFDEPIDLGIVFKATCFETLAREVLIDLGFVLSPMGLLPDSEENAQSEGGQAGENSHDSG